MSGWAVLCGLAIGVGAWLVVSVLPRLTRPSLAARVAPYVLDVSEEARVLLARRTADPLPVFGLALTPLVTTLRDALGGALGGSETVRLRLRQAGRALEVDEYRLRQLAWAATGLAAGIAADAALAASRSVAGAVLVALPLVSGGLAIVVQERLLAHAAAARLKRLGEELPTVLEFLALSLSAGEGVSDGVRRLARIGSGELARELAGVVAETRTGVPFPLALSQLSSALRLPALERAVGTIVAALERGTPLAEVLRAQAQDARSDAKKRLLEVAGQKEVAMLLPLVFAILPITVLFAVFPGVFVLRSGF